MKHSLKAVIAAILFACSFSACDSDNNLGIQMMPASDEMSVVSDSFYVTVVSQLADHVFSVTDKLALGSYDDPVFGALSVDFLAELRFVNGAFPDNAVADSLSLVLYYKSFFGDSSAVQEVTVYQMTAPLTYNADYYTDTDPAGFCDRSIVLGQKSFTAYDPAIPDDQRAEYGCNVLRVPVSDELMQTLFSDVAATQSQAAFLELLKGVYVTCQGGNSCVLALDSVNLELNYHAEQTVESTGTTTTEKYTRVYAANREATQVLHVSRPTGTGVSVDDLQSVYQDSVVLISTPAGYFPKVSLPFDRIYQRVCLDHADETDGMLNINHASLAVEVASTDYSGAYRVPPMLMLIEERYVDAFFHQSLYPSRYPNVLGVYSDSTRTYTFNNMCAYIESVLKKDAPNFENVGDFVLVPVCGPSDIYGNGGKVRHQFAPYGAFYRSGKNAKSPMRLTITYTNL
ncbi:MAG: DUF4270 domain-containing protein [Paludibacteraceae bacterium]|nr:DUF4270 domain-containing protein [Paludibacteraceae bacterium]